MQQKKHKTRLNEQGEVFIGFILVAMIIGALIWATIDLSRYAYMKSTTQSALSAVTYASKSEDALLLEHADRSNADNMSRISVSRQRLSDIYKDSEEFKYGAKQLNPIPVHGYGRQSGPDIGIGETQYIAILPPGTSAKFVFPNGEEQWVHHSTCCDPSVDSCRVEQRRGNTTNQCGRSSYLSLVGKFPTEFISMSVANNTQIFSAPIISRTSGFPRVQVIAAPTISPSPSPTPPIIVDCRTQSSVSCAFDERNKTIVITTQIFDPCLKRTTTTQEIKKPELAEGCYLDRGGYLTSKPDPNTNGCTFKEEVRTIEVGPYSCELDQTQTLLTKSTPTINPATCVVSPSISTATKQAARCVEHDGYSWLAEDEKNLLTCSWDVIKTKKSKTPKTICHDDGTIRTYKLTRPPECNYEESSQPINNPNPQCNEDGTRFEYKFSNAVCDWIKTAESTIPRPEDTLTCSETKTGAQRTDKKYSFKAKDPAGQYVCQWIPTETTAEVVAPADSCELDENSGNGLKTTYRLDAKSCTYKPQEPIVIPKVADQCVHDEQAYRATKTSYAFDSNSCSFIEREKTVSDGAPVCIPVSEVSDTYERISYTFDDSSCSYKEGAGTTETKKTELCNTPGIRTEATFDTSPLICKYSYHDTTITKPEDSCINDKKTTYVWDKNSCNWEAQTTSESCGGSCVQAPTGTAVSCGLQQSIPGVRVVPFATSVYNGRPRMGKPLDPSLMSTENNDTWIGADSAVIVSCNPGEYLAGYCIANSGDYYYQLYELSRSTTSASLIALNGNDGDSTFTGYYYCIPCCCDKGDCVAPPSQPQDSLFKLNDWAGGGRPPRFFGQSTSDTTCKQTEEKPLCTKTEKPADRCVEHKIVSHIWDEAQCAWKEQITSTNCGECTSFKLSVGTGLTTDWINQGEEFKFCGTTPAKTCLSAEEVARTNENILQECRSGDVPNCRLITYDPTCVPSPSTNNLTDPLCAPYCIQTLMDRITSTLGAIIEGRARAEAPPRVQGLFNGYSQQGATCLIPDGNRCALFEMYFDKNCKQIPGPVSGPACASRTLEPRYTPISLVWNGDTSAAWSMGMTTTQFKVNPQQGGKWYSWRASSQLPLLVKKGVEPAERITGKSLFGSFTDGGKLVGGKRIPWTNGFEPLRLMDTNADHILNQKELDAMSLWFDNDRDGVIDTGELMELREMGVTKIYLGNEEHDATLQVPIIQQGFERRTEKGKVISGALIDWGTASGMTPESATIRSQSTKQEEKMAIADQKKTTVDIRKVSSEVQSELRGVWNFHINGVTDPKRKADIPGDGALTLEVDIDGGISGISMTHTPIAPNDADVRSIVRAVLLSGHITSVTQKYIDFEFTITNPEVAGERSGIFTRARLHRKNGTMTGTSKIDAKIRSDVGRFDWMAQKEH
jgi:hypothetical protein